MEFAYQHPAAEEIHRIFESLKVDSDEKYRNLSRRERYLWDVCVFEGAVMNGGLDHYLNIDDGEHVYRCLEALNAIGAGQSFSLLKRACDLFPEGLSPDHDTRERDWQVLVGTGSIHDLIDGDIELDLYQHLLDYYRAADPNERGEVAQD